MVTGTTRTFPNSREFSELHALTSTVTLPMGDFALAEITKKKGIKKGRKVPLREKRGEGEYGYGMNEYVLDVMVNSASKRDHKTQSEGLRKESSLLKGFLGGQS